MLQHIVYQVLYCSSSSFLISPNPKNVQQIWQKLELYLCTIVYMDVFSFFCTNSEILLLLSLSPPPLSFSLSLPLSLSLSRSLPERSLVASSSSSELASYSQLFSRTSDGGSVGSSCSFCCCLRSILSKLGPPAFTHSLTRPSQLEALSSILPEDTLVLLLQQPFSFFFSILLSEVQSPSLSPSPFVPFASLAQTLLASSTVRL